MHFSTFLLLPALALAAINEPCYGPSGRAGVCITTSDCSAAGGTSISGACPSDPDNVKCCSKPTCGTGGSGNCRWTSDCAGTSTANQCPGPSQMKCCSSSAQGWGGYSAPTYPSVGACKSVSVNGAKKIVAAFPGRVREIGCKRDCDSSSTSDHCDGMAVDMMIADGGGRATISGKEIAEWVMKNRSTLSLKYVIWGQKIWDVGTDKNTEKAWSNWRTMDDRGDLTANHWDHVHVSFK